MEISLEEWIDFEEFDKFRQEVAAHLETTTSATEEEIEATTRCIMVSLRREWGFRCVE